MTWPRVTTRCAIFLLIGLIINILVAWGCVCWSPCLHTFQSRKAGWPAPVPDDWPATAWRNVNSGFGVCEIEAFRILHDRDSQSSFASQRAWCAGWPVRCCFIEAHGAGSVLNAPALNLSASWADGLEIPEWIPWCEYNDRQANAGLGSVVSGSMMAAQAGPTNRRLPTRVYPMGFTINVLFYAGLCALILTPCGMILRQRRRHAGHCPACGYDLRANTTGVCPECGAPTAPVVQK